MRDVKSLIDRVYERSKTGFQDTPDSPEETTYGPVSHWFYEEALAFASNYYVKEFTDFIPDGDERSGDFKVTWSICKGIQKLRFINKLPYLQMPGLISQGTRPIGRNLNTLRQDEK